MQFHSEAAKDIDKKDYSGVTLLKVEMNKDLQKDPNSVKLIHTENKAHFGGEGLVSTMADYTNFCEMLLGKGSFRGEEIVSKEGIKKSSSKLLYRTNSNC